MIILSSYPFLRSAMRLLLSLLLAAGFVQAVHADEALPGYRHQKPSSASSGLPLSLTVYAPAPYSRPQLMFRRDGEHAYRSVSFSAEPDGYYVASIPAEELLPPRLQYYIVIDTPKAAR